MTLALPASAGYVWGAKSVNSTALRQAVTLEGVRSHQAALQSIADANDGDRASGSPGFDASVAYVKSTLRPPVIMSWSSPSSFRFFRS